MGGGEAGEIRRGETMMRKWRTLIPLAAALAAATLAALTGIASAQENPFMPKMSLQGEQKKQLTPEEQERQKQLDEAYKAATNKIPNQTTNDPWASVRSTPAAPAPKKKPQ